MIGIDYFKGEMDLNANYTDYNGDASRDYERTTTAFFTSIRHSISERWDWIGNLRYQKGENELAYAGTTLRDVNDEDWASGVGLVRKFGDEGRIYTSARRFFRYPSADELVTFGSSFPWPPINHPNLVPENGYEVELGFDLNGKSILLSGRVFRQWMEQEIIFDNVSFQNVNLDDTGRLGLDLSLIWELADYASTGVNYEFVRAEIEKGTYRDSKIPLVSESLMRLFLELQLLESLFFNIGGSYVGGSFVGNDLSNGDNKMEDYWLFDLGVNYQLSEGATLFGGVENLLDQEYLSTAYGTALYPGEGRKATVGSELFLLRLLPALRAHAIQHNLKTLYIKSLWDFGRRSILCCICQCIKLITRSAGKVNLVFAVNPFIAWRLPWIVYPYNLH